MNNPLINGMYSRIGFRDSIAFILRTNTNPPLEGDEWLEILIYNKKDWRCFYWDGWGINVGTLYSSVFNEEGVA